jgi:hypothetical protein
MGATRTTIFRLDGENEFDFVAKQRHAITAVYVVR